MERREDYEGYVVGGGWGREYDFDININKSGEICYN